MAVGFGRRVCFEEKIVFDWWTWDNVTELFSDMLTEDFWTDGGTTAFFGTLDAIRDYMMNGILEPWPNYVLDSNRQKLLDKANYHYQELNQTIIGVPTPEQQKNAAALYWSRMADEVRSAGEIELAVLLDTAKGFARENAEGASRQPSAQSEKGVPWWAWLVGGLVLYRVVLK